MNALMKVASIGLLTLAVSAFAGNGKQKTTVTKAHKVETCGVHCPQPCPFDCPPGCCSK